MIVTLAWAVGETKAPGAGPRYTSNTLSSPGMVLSGPRATVCVTENTPAGSRTSLLASVKSSPAKWSAYVSYNHRGFQSKELGADSLLI